MAVNGGGFLVISAIEVDVNATTWDYTTPDGALIASVAKGAWYTMEINFHDDGAGGLAATHRIYLTDTGAPLGSSTDNLLEGEDVNLEFAYADLGGLNIASFQMFEPVNQELAIDNWGWDAALIPEPASLGVLAIGALGLLLHRRRTI